MTLQENILTAHIFIVDSVTFGIHLRHLALFICARLTQRGRGGEAAGALRYSLMSKDCK